MALVVRDDDDGRDSWVAHVASVAGTERTTKYTELIVLLIREAAGLVATPLACATRPSTAELKLYIANTVLEFEARFIKGFGELKRQANKAASDDEFVARALAQVTGPAIPEARDVVVALLGGGSSTDGGKVLLEPPVNLEKLFAVCRSKKLAVTENAVAEWAVNAIAWSMRRGESTSCTPLDKCAAVGVRTRPVYPPRSRSPALPSPIEVAPPTPLASAPVPSPLSLS